MSDVGVGTEVSISFRVASDPVPEPRSRVVARPSRGTETVLLVEDEPGVRNLAVRSLERHGYRVLPAARGDEAIEIAKSHDGPIQLLITDVIMPGMSGPDLVQQVIVIRPDIRGFYISGYADDEVDESDVRFDLLPKPFTPSSLIEMVELVLATPN